MAAILALCTAQAQMRLVLGKWFDVLLHLLHRRTLPEPANICPALENPEPLQVLLDATLKTATPPTIACLNTPQHPEHPNHYRSLGSTLCVRNLISCCCSDLASRHTHCMWLRCLHRRRIPWCLHASHMHSGPTDTDPPPITEWRRSQWGSTDFYLIVPLGCHQRDGRLYSCLTSFVRQYVVPSRHCPVRRSLHAIRYISIYGLLIGHRIIALTTSVHSCSWYDLSFHALSTHEFIDGFMC